MAKLVLNDITSTTGLTTAINVNSALIEAALENTISRDGTSPNTMSGDLDMNSYSILNLPSPVNDGDPARKVDLTSAISTYVAHPITSAEITAGVTPVSYQYPPGHAWRYMSTVEISEAQEYTFSTSHQSALQACIDLCWKNNLPMILPSGGYLVTGLTITGITGIQATILRLCGEGFGNPFAAYSTPKGTVIKSVTNTPVLYINAPDAATASPGTIDISGVMFDGTSDGSPVVYFEAFYGVSNFSKNFVLQRGTNNGLQIDWMATGYIDQCYFMNSEWMLSGVSSARTGIGVYLSQNYDAGLQTISKCSSRGWLTCYKLGVSSTSKYLYSASIRDSECSTSYNGIHLTDSARACLIDNCFFEGGEEGVAIWDEGDYNKVTNNFSFSGYSFHLKSTEFTYGNTYTGNTFAAGTTASSVLVDITSSSVYGGPAKTLSNNHLSFGGSGGAIAGVIGIRINGTDPRIDLSGNSFYPRGPWVGGAGTTKVSDLSAGGIYGFSVALNGDYEMPYLSRGAIGLQDVAVSEADVSATILTILGGSYFVMTAGGATSVTRLETGSDNGKFIVIRTTNADCTFSDGTYIQLAGGASFAGPGTITFICNRSSGATYAYELTRTVF
jgi:hypothetical protein